MTLLLSPSALPSSGDGGSLTSLLTQTGKAGRRGGLRSGVSIATTGLRILTLLAALSIASSPPSSFLPSAAAWWGCRNCQGTWTGASTTDRAIDSSCPSADSNASGTDGSTESGTSCTLPSASFSDSAGVDEARCGTIGLTVEHAKRNC